MAGLILSVSLIFTGCSNNEEDGQPSSTSEVAQEESAQVSETVNNYYNSLIEQSSASMDVSDDVEVAIREITGDETYEAFSSSSNPFESFNEISDEQAKELADRLEELNPVSDLFNYSEMNDRDRAILNLLNMASSIMFLSSQEETIQISIPAEAIAIDGNTATVAYSDMVFKVGESEQPMTDVLGGTDLSLTKIEGEWKLDGQKTYESTRDNALKAQPSDGGGSDNGEG